MEFSYHIDKLDHVSVIALKGGITTEAALEPLSLDIASMIEKNQVNLVFNTRDLSHINSSGINLFMRTLTKTRVKNGDLVFFGVHGNVDKLFKIVKLNEIYTIYETQQEAVDHFKKN
jgi:anti-sigma B factor antagonist